MRAEGVGKGEGGKNQRVGQLLPNKGPEWMGICRHEQDIGLPSKLGIYFFSQGVWLMTYCVLCKYKQDFVHSLKINHAWSAPSSWV
jgi:hypothetical protein